MKKIVRIKDIAEKAGVSIGTVDRVLHNRGEVKSSTKDKVLSIAKELNYTPNLAARALKSPVSYNIAVIIPCSTNGNQFWGKHPQGIELGQESTAPFITKVNYYYYEMHNSEDFLKQASLLVKDKPDGVIIAPILKNETIDLCTKLDEQNIPYAYIDTNIENANALTYVGENAFQGGRVAASLIDLGVEKNKDILIVNITKNLENILHLNLRNQGFMSYFMDAGKNKGLKISVEIPSANKQDVSEVLDRVLKNNPNIGGIMVSSARTFVIAEYLKEKNLENLFLVGYEVFEENTNYLKEGIINFLVSQRPVEQSEKTFKRLFNYLANNIQPEKIEYQPIEIINKENIDLL